MAIDPICGMTIEPAKAAGHFDYEGTTYHFCSVHCLERFRAAPDQYVKKASVAAAGMPGAGRRSLPMMQTMPDQYTVAGGERDPVCGMRVQPATAAASHLYADKTYYFCCQGCLETFLTDPARYLPAASMASPEAPRQFEGNELPMLAASPPGEAAVGVIDPVCGMTVDIASAKYMSEYQEQLYYFCAPGCKLSFDRTPEKYTNIPVGGAPIELIS